MIPTSIETVLVSSVTASGRELVASLLESVPLYVCLHVGEPSPSDPLSTLVNISGVAGRRVTWAREGSILYNAAPLTFAGVGPNSLVSWLAIGMGVDGDRICFYGDIANTAYSGTEWGVFTIPEKSIKIVVA